jgi:hypothetical protein
MKYNRKKRTIVILLFFGLVSRLNASVTPRIASGGPISTFVHHALNKKRNNSSTRLKIKILLR